MADALNQKSRGVLPSVGSREWQMLKTVDSLDCSTVIRLREH